MTYQTTYIKVDARENGSSLMAEVARGECIDYVGAELAYAASIIGKMILIASSAYDDHTSMTRLFDGFQAANGTPSVVWLDHLWNGVKASGALWAA